MSKRRSEEHTSELQSRGHLVCRLLLEKKTIANTRWMVVSLVVIGKIAPLRTCVNDAVTSNKTTRSADHFSRGKLLYLFFLKYTAPPEIYTFPQHAALPI